jgi:hypothetical protein
MSSASAGRSAGKVLLLGAAVVIALSLLMPISSLAGPLGVMVGFVAITVLLVGRPRGRPPRDSARRISGYLVRSDIFAVPEAVLVGLALAELADRFARDASVWTLAIIGVMGGGTWAVLRRLQTKSLIGDQRSGIKDLATTILGGAALISGVGVLVHGDACTAALPTKALIVVGAVALASVGLALLIGMSKWAVLHRAHLASYSIAAVGLVEFVKFAHVPNGLDIVEDLSGWAAAPLVAGLAAASFLVAVNPKLGEAVIGVAVAVTTGYLLLYEARLNLGALLAPGPCDSFARAAWTVIPVVLFAVFAGSR